MVVKYGINVRFAMDNNGVSRGDYQWSALNALFASAISSSVGMLTTIIYSTFCVHLSFIHSKAISKHTFFTNFLYALPNPLT